MYQRISVNPIQLRKNYANASTEKAKVSVLYDFISGCMPYAPYKLENKSVTFTDRIWRIRKNDSLQNSNDIVMGCYIPVAGRLSHIGSLIFKNFASDEGIPTITYSNALMAEMLGVGTLRRRQYFREVELEKLCKPAITNPHEKTDADDLIDLEQLKWLQRYLYVESYLYELCMLMGSTKFTSSKAIEARTANERPSLSAMVEEFRRLDREKLARGDNPWNLGLRLLFPTALFLGALAAIIGSIVVLVLSQDVNVGCIMGIGLGVLTGVGSAINIGFHLFNKNPARFRPSSVSEGVYNVDALLEEALSLEEDLNQDVEDGKNQDDRYSSSPISQNYQSRSAANPAIQTKELDPEHPLQVHNPSL